MGRIASKPPSSLPPLHAALGTCLTVASCVLLFLQQPVPVACESCCAQGMKECEWCSGSGYFVLGDKMLCEVPSRNTHCVICHGEVRRCQKLPVSLLRHTTSHHVLSGLAGRAPRPSASLPERKGEERTASSLHACTRVSCAPHLFPYHGLFQGNVRCADCHGTGFRARWLETVAEKKK